MVESLIGADISVKDQAMATRRPLLLTLIRTERGSLWAQFRDGEKLYSQDAIKVDHPPNDPTTLMTSRVIPLSS